VSRFANEPIVVPSLLAADAAHLRSQVLQVVAAGAKALHIDVMDGHFVPSLGFSLDTVSSLREALNGREVLLDVHLMVERPVRFVRDFAAAGADVITVHAETGLEVRRAIELVHDAGCFAGLAVGPRTTTDVFFNYVYEVDLALCMTVEPGRGGQRFIGRSLERIAELRRILPARTPIEVDGGINLDTAPLCADRGARLLVAGSAVFGSRDPGLAYTHLTTRARLAAPMQLEAA